MLAEPPPSPASRPAMESIPRGLRVGALYAGCLLIVAAGMAVVVLVVVKLADVAIPAMMGVILCALLMPPCRFLRRHRWPKWAAIATSWLGVLVVIGLLTTLVVQQVIAHLPEFSQQFNDLYASILAKIDERPLGLTDAMVRETGERASTWLREHAEDIGLQTWLAGQGILRVLTGSIIAVLVSVFLLWDGARIWQWVVNLFPAAARPHLESAGRAGWHTLVEFPRVQVLVALIDAVLIGLGALLLGVPMVLPIATITFLGALIPIIGAILAGAIAVALAMLANGWVNAAAMLAIVLAVNQIESHVVQPMLAGNAFRVHPLVVILGVFGGMSVGGILGAFFAVPVIATVNAMVLAARENQARSSWGEGP